MNRCVLSAFAVVALAGVAQADIYTGGSVGAIPDSAGSNVSGTPGVYTLNVASSGTIASFNSISINIGHTWIGDLLITLTSPGGQTADVLVRAGVATATSAGFGMNLGTSNASSNVPPALYTFVNSGGSLINTDLASGFLPAGTYNRLPAANGTVVQTGASGNDFSVFTGGDVNGIWTLRIRDFFTGDTGAVAALAPSTFEGWSLDITVPTPGAAALLGLGGLVIGRRRR